MQDSSYSVSDLPVEVAASPHMQFAIAVSKAVTQRNYVRFFRLFQQSDLLPACAMHRIFTRVRTEAMEVMMKGLQSSPASPATLPIVKFTSLLGFNSINDALEFAAHYGKDCSTVRTCLLVTVYLIAYAG